MIDHDLLTKRLIEDFGVASLAAPLIANQLQALPTKTQTAFTAWWNNGELPTWEIEGWSHARLMNERGMTVIAAFLTLGWLERDPLAAKRSLARPVEGSRP